MLENITLARERELLSADPIWVLQPLILKASGMLGMLGK